MEAKRKQFKYYEISSSLEEYDRCYLPYCERAIHKNFETKELATVYMEKWIDKYKEQIDCNFDAKKDRYYSLSKDFKYRTVFNRIEKLEDTFYLIYRIEKRSANKVKVIDEVVVNDKKYKREEEKVEYGEWEQVMTSSDGFYPKDKPYESDVYFYVVEKTIDLIIEFSGEFDE